jgi:hypothetical protein
MVKRSLFAAAILSAGLMVGCGSSTPPSSQPAAEAEAPKIPIPADSPFAKIKEGMGYDEVISILGQPSTPPYSYQTGKAFIPFHYGGDNWRRRAHWKGLGAITFSSDSSFSTNVNVMSIDYDPADKGFEPGT